VHTLESAMAAALLDRSVRRNPDELAGALGQGIAGLARLALALAIVGAFCAALEIVSAASGWGGAPAPSAWDGRCIPVGAEPPGGSQTQGRSAACFVS